MPLIRARIDSFVSVDVSLGVDRFSGEFLMFISHICVYEFTRFWSLSPNIAPYCLKSKLCQVSVA